MTSMSSIEILEIHVEPIARDIVGRTSGLQGKVKVKSPSQVTLEFDLSPETIRTIAECVERDFDGEIALLKGDRR